MDEDALYAAAFAGDADAIAKLEMQADRVHEFGYTILHDESLKGNTERVRFILREFAHKNLLAKLNHYKQTALHYAAILGHTEVAEMLIDAARHLPVGALMLKLNEEKSAAIQQGNKLRQELELLMRGSGTRSQGGVSVKFVAIVGLISILVGYLMK